MIRAILGRIYLSRGFGGVIKELLVALGGGKGGSDFHRGCIHHRAASSACFRRIGERGFGYLLSRAWSEADLVAFRSISRHLALIGSPEAVGRSAIERRGLHGQRSREAGRRGRTIAVPPRSGKRFETDDDAGRSRFAQPTGPEGRAYVRLSSRDLKKIQVSLLNGTCSATARVGRLSAVMRMSPAPLANNM